VGSALGRSDATPLVGIALAVLVAGCAGSGSSVSGSAQSTAGACVQTPGRVASSFTPFGSVYALGGGPVYPLFDTLPYVPGRQGGLGRVRYGSALLGRWHYVKTLWISAPSYHGAVTVTGTAVGGSGRLAFAVGVVRVTTLQIPPGGGSGWGTYSTGTLLSQPGCYVFNVKLGDSRSYRVEFAAAAD
jgi:hypothetical protein